MLYKNGLIYLTGRGFVHGGFSVESGRFREIYERDMPEGEDLHGCLVIPGLVDIHIHGAAGADFSDGDFAGLKRMAGYLASRGVTSFIPTAMTLPYNRLERAFKTARLFMGPDSVRSHEFSESLRQARTGLDGDKCEYSDGCCKPAMSRVLGVRMEGPFLSERKRGSQNPAYLKSPDFNEFTALNDACGGLIKIVDVAPELDGAVEFAKNANRLCVVSAAHTEADYNTALAFFDAGASHITHLFNAMTPLNHREPGVIGAAFDRPDVTAEIIADGVHIHPAAVRMAFSLFNKRLCLISDALSCLNMPDGTFKLGGLDVILKNGEARLKDGSIAGSTVDLFTCLQRAVSFGIPINDAIDAATIIPAGVMGASSEIGSIAPGKLADFIVCDEALELKWVCVGGGQKS